MAIVSPPKTHSVRKGPAKQRNIQVPIWIESILKGEKALQALEAE
jgi:hypothetical protein